MPNGLENNRNENGTDRTLQRLRDEIKILEDGLHKTTADNHKALKEIERLRRENEHLRKERERLEEEIRQLKGVPDWVKPNKSVAEERSAKKRGPKKGHKAHPRKIPERVDREINLIPRECPHCHNKHLPKPTKWHSHTQVDIPPITLPIVTRYNVGWSFCSECEREVSVGGKLSHSKYGPNLHAQVCYWKYQMGLTLGKISRLLFEQYGLSISTGQIAELLNRSAKEFAGQYEAIEMSLPEAAHLHADETGWRVDGDNRWLWSFSNDSLSYYRIEAGRGQKVVDAVLGGRFDGVLITDCYSAYNKIDCMKQKCWTHLLRETRELKEKYPRDKEVAWFHGRMKRFFKRGVKLQTLYQEGKDIEKAYRRLIDDTQRWMFRIFRNAELNRVRKRLIRHRDELYTFIKSGVSPTNNNGEREIRPAVLMRKTSYGNRSDRGSDTQAILMSVIRTCFKQNVDFTRFAANHLQNH